MEYWNFGYIMLNLNKLRYQREDLDMQANQFTEICTVRKGTQREKAFGLPYIERILLSVLRFIT